MLNRFIKFTFNVFLITFILVIGFEFSGALAQDLETGGSGLTVAGTEDVDISSDIDKRPLGAVILSIVNYFIGFLGFVAVIMFVYAGVLWVVAGGDDDQITKAKKIMTYSALGIIIVILSYSIVRFIASSAGGGETCSTDADCPNNAICGEDNYCKFPIEGGGVCSDNGDCAQGLTCNNGSCQLPVGNACLASKDCGSGQYCSESSVCKDGGSETCNVDSDCDGDQKCDAFGFCHDTSGTSGAQCEQNAQCATGYVCNLDKSECEIQGVGGQGGIQGGENQGLTLESLDKMDGSLDKVQTDFENVEDEIKNLNFSPELKQQLDEILAGDGLQAKVDGVQNFINQAGPFDAISQGTLQRLVSGLEGLLLVEGQLLELKTVMPESAKTIAAWDAAQTALNELSKDPKSNLKLTQFENRYQAVKDLALAFPVVQSRINATPGQGNAPLMVVFDGLNSFDPTGGTITDYKWSFLDSDGNLQSLGNSPVVTYEFNEPNTYNVRLQVSTSNTDQGGYKMAMDGVSNVLVRVTPPESQIGFRINEIEVGEAHSITEEEAKTGVKFDPSITVPGVGKTIVKYEWFYGDALSEVRSVPSPVIHSYAKPGEYFVTLKVTDNQGVSDKKVVKLVVKSLAADIEIAPGEEGGVNTEYRFEGSQSRSDNGFINSYAWKITDQDNVTVVESSDENFLHTFERPGRYMVELAAGDSTGAQDKVIQEFEVLSREPVANFNFTTPKTNHPNTIKFDASESYDPDKGDQITYSWDFDGDGQFEIVDSAESIAEYTYRRTGNFKAILQVQDDFGKRNQIEKEIPIESILSADIETTKKVVQIGEELTFNVSSSTAVAYLWEFGDGETLTTEEATATHTYNAAGKYTVKLNFFDREDNTNSVTYTIFVGQGDAPLALAEVSVLGVTPAYTENLCGEGFDGYTISRSDNLSFTATNSLNRDGSARLLTYDWQFSDGTRQNKKDFSHRFTELTPEGECFSISLMVRDEVTGTVSPEDTLYFKVVNQVPTLRDFIVQQEDQKELVTPTKVKLQIIGASDPDGQVSRYRWWYYQEGAEDQRLGMHFTTTPETEMVIVAQGEPGLKNKYFFAVELVDNDGGVFESTERFGQASFLEVTNGPNVAPVAEFTTDKTTVSTGDDITFISTAYDPQGEVLGNTAFQWDFDGDGAFDDTTTGPQVSHQYNTPGEYEVRLRVTHRGLSSSVRQTVFIQATNSYPQASFSYSVVDNTVNFDATNSTSDRDLSNTSLTYAWDFDVQDDADGNGINDDDVESTEATPTHIYGRPGLYRVKLVIKDSSGMEGISVRDIDLNLTSADRLQRTRRTIQLKAPEQPITLLNLEVSPFQLGRGGTADILATIQNADNSSYQGSVFFELLEGTGEFSPTPVKAIDSKAKTVFTAVEPGEIRIRVTATDTFYGDLSEEIFINVQ